MKWPCLALPRGWKLQDRVGDLPRAHKVIVRGRRKIKSIRRIVVAIFLSVGHGRQRWTKKPVSVID